MGEGVSIFYLERLYLKTFCAALWSFNSHLNTLWLSFLICTSVFSSVQQSWENQIKLQITERVSAVANSPVGKSTGEWLSSDQFPPNLGNSSTIKGDSSSTGLESRPNRWGEALKSRKEKNLKMQPRRKGSRLRILFLKQYLLRLLSCVTLSFVICHASCGGCVCCCYVLFLFLCFSFGEFRDTDVVCWKSASNFK